jgi:hypothetical protein
MEPSGFQAIARRPKIELMLELLLGRSQGYKHPSKLLAQKGFW